MNRFYIWPFVQKDVTNTEFVCPKVILTEKWVSVILYDKTSILVCHMSINIVIMNGVMSEIMIHV